MPYSHKYDYIIAGGGCAGLSLVYYLLQTKLKNRRILIIDQTPKTHNDRTWCFWEKSPNAFEHLVYHRWQHMYFYSQTFGKKLDLAPYAYKMIRGIDFYQHILELIRATPQIELLQATVERLDASCHKAQVTVDGIVYEADWVFNSIRQPNEAHQAVNYHYLLQHFKGKIIQTDKPFFNPNEAVLMDFRVDQQGDCRFVYVLPTDPYTALVEYTIFSESLIEQAGYDQAIEHYLRNFLCLDTYQTVHEEFGVIPMTDMPYAPQQAQRIINIGTAGGLTKPSTGYTFLRIQQDAQALVRGLVTQDRPLRQQHRWQQRFRLYDGALLYVLAQKLQPADRVFTDLFKNNPTERVFKFLDEDTRLWEEVQVANSVPRLAFARGIWHAIAH